MPDTIDDAPFEPDFHAEPGPAYDTRATADRDCYPWRNTRKGFVGIPPTLDQYRQSVDDCQHCAARDGKHCQHTAGLIRHARY